MAQDNYDENLDYQFSDEEGGEVYDVDTEDAGSTEATDYEEEVTPPEILEKKKPSKRNVFLLLIMLVLFGFLGYKVYSLLFSGEAKSLVSAIPALTKAPVKEKQLPTLLQKEKKPIVQPSVTTPDAKQSSMFDTMKSTIEPQVKKPAEKILAKPTPVALEPAKPKVVAQPQKSEPQVDAVTKAQLEKLQAQNIKLSADLSQQQAENQARLGALNSKLLDVHDSVQGVQGAVQHLANQYKRLEQQRRLEAARKARLAAQAKARHEKAIRHSKRYFVDAVIPGRAWLHGVDGSSMTVTVGDMIPGYGKVVAIDSYSGNVSTSSGIKIRYGVSN